MHDRFGIPKHDNLTTAIRSCYAITGYRGYSSPDVQGLSQQVRETP